MLTSSLLFVYYPTNTHTHKYVQPMYSTYWRQLSFGQCQREIFVCSCWRCHCLCLGKNFLCRVCGPLCFLTCNFCCCCRSKNLRTVVVAACCCCLFTLCRIARKRGALENYFYFCIRNTVCRTASLPRPLAARRGCCLQHKNTHTDTFGLAHIGISANCWSTFPNKFPSAPQTCLEISILSHVLVTQLSAIVCVPVYLCVRCVCVQLMWPHL